MTDFGFGAILDRIERDFGRSWAKGLTIMVAIGMLAACLTLVGNLISSAALWLSGIASESTLWGKIVVVGKYALGFGVMIVLAHNFVAVAVTRRHGALARQLAGESENHLLRIKETGSHFQDNIAEFRRIILQWADICPDEAIVSELRRLHQRIDGGGAKRGTTIGETQMTDDSKLPGEGMIVTALQSQDPERDVWLVTGPYWEAGGDGDALAAFSSMIEGETEALRHARELVEDMPGCKLVIEHRGR